MSHYIKLFFRLLIGISLIIAIVRISGIDLDELWLTVRQINFYLAALTVIPLLVIDRLLMSYKWNLLLKAIGIEIGLWANFKIYMSSTFVGLALPSTIGADLIRTYQLSASNFPTEGVLASVIVERLLGFGAVIIFTLFASPILAISYPELRPYAFVILAMALGFLVLCLGSLWSGFTKLIKRGLPHVIGHKFTTYASRVYRAYRVYGEHNDIVILFFALSVAETAITIMTVMIIGNLMAIDVPWFTYILIVPLVLFVIRVPISINGIGVIEVFYVLLFVGVGMDSTDALSLGLVADAVGILVGLSGGLILLLDVLKFQSKKH